MDEYFDNIIVASLDGSECYDFSGISRAMRLSSFKSVVAMKLQRQHGRYVSPAELELTAFGNPMMDGEMTLAGYGIENGMTITRVDVVPEANTPARPNAGGPGVLNPLQMNPPPYDGQAAAPPDDKRLSNIFFQEDHRTHTLRNVPVTSTVEELFQRLKSEKGIDKDKAQVFLIFGGKQFAEGRGLTLIDYDVQENSTIIMVQKQYGGFQSFGNLFPY